MLLSNYSIGIFKKLSQCECSITFFPGAEVKILKNVYQSLPGNKTSHNFQHPSIRLIFFKQFQTSENCSNCHTIKTDIVFYLRKWKILIKIIKLWSYLQGL